MSKQTKAKAKNPPVAEHEQITEDNCAPFSEPAAKQMVHNAMRLLGITKILVDFSGGGDSGQVNEVHFLNAKDEEVDVSRISGQKFTLKTGSRQFDSNTNMWVPVVEDKECDLAEICEQACYDAAEETHLDWCNNEGGQGELIGTMDDDFAIHWTLKIGINRTATDDHEFEL